MTDLLPHADRSSVVRSADLMLPISNDTRPNLSLLGQSDNESFSAGDLDDLVGRLVGPDRISKMNRSDAVCRKIRQNERPLRRLDERKVDVRLLERPTENR